MSPDRDAVWRYSRDDGTLVVEEYSPPREGAPTFVLVHGIGMGRSVFADLVGHLRDHGRVIALDLPGYGEAPEPATTPSIERMADLVASMLSSRRIKDAVLVGHSMGSQVVAEVAARHPGVVARLVLVGPTVNERERTALQQVLRLGQDLAIESPMVLVRGAREYLRAGPHLRRKMRAMLVHRPEDAYPRIEAPTLVLRGEDDRVCPHYWCELVARLLPDGRLREIDGHGHETMIRDAAPAAALLVAFAEGA